MSTETLRLNDFQRTRAGETSQLYKSAEAAAPDQQKSQLQDFQDQIRQELTACKLWLSETLRAVQDDVLHANCKNAIEAKMAKQLDSDKTLQLSKQFQALAQTVQDNSASSAGLSAVEIQRLLDTSKKTITSQSQLFAQQQVEAQVRPLEALVAELQLSIRALKTQQESAPKLTQEQAATLVDGAIARTLQPVFQRIQALEQQKAFLASCSSAVPNQVEGIAAELKHAKDQIAALEASLNASVQTTQHDMLERHHETEHFDIQIKQLAEQLVSAQAKASQLNDKTDDSLKVLKRQIEQIQTTVEDSGSQIQLLTKNVQQIEQPNDQIRSQLDSLFKLLHSDNKAHADRMDQLAARQQSLESQEEKSQKQLGRLSAIEQKQDKIEKFENEIESRVRQILTKLLGDEQMMLSIQNPLFNRVKQLESMIVQLQNEKDNREAALQRLFSDALQRYQDEVDKKLKKLEYKFNQQKLDFAQRGDQIHGTMETQYAQFKTQVERALAEERQRGTAYVDCQSKMWVESLARTQASFEKLQAATNGELRKQGERVVLFQLELKNQREYVQKTTQQTREEGKAGIEALQASLDHYLDVQNRFQTGASERFIALQTTYAAHQQGLQSIQKELEVYTSKLQLQLTEQHQVSLALLQTQTSQLVQNAFKDMKQAVDDRIEQTAGALRRQTTQVQTDFADLQKHVKFNLPTSEKIEALGQRVDQQKQSVQLQLQKTTQYVDTQIGQISKLVESQGKRLSEQVAADMQKFHDAFTADALHSPEQSIAEIALRQSAASGTLQELQFQVQALGESVKLLSEAQGNAQKQAVTAAEQENAAQNSAASASQLGAKTVQMQTQIDSLKAQINSEVEGVEKRLTEVVTRVGDRLDQLQSVSIPQQQAEVQQNISKITVTTVQYQQDITAVLQGFRAELQGQIDLLARPKHSEEVVRTILQEQILQPIQAQITAQKIEFQTLLQKAQAREPIIVEKMVAQADQGQFETKVARVAEEVAATKAELQQQLSQFSQYVQKQFVEYQESTEGVVQQLIDTFSSNIVENPHLKAWFNDFSQRLLALDQANEQATAHNQQINKYMETQLPAYQKALDSIADQLSRQNESASKAIAALSSQQVILQQQQNDLQKDGDKALDECSAAKRQLQTLADSMPTRVLELMEISLQKINAEVAELRSSFSGQIQVQFQQSLQVLNQQNQKSLSLLQKQVCDASERLQKRQDAQEKTADQARQELNDSLRSAKQVWLGATTDVLKTKEAAADLMQRTALIAKQTEQKIAGVAAAIDSNAARVKDLENKMAEKQTAQTDALRSALVDTFKAHAAECAQAAEEKCMFALRERDAEKTQGALRIGELASQLQTLEKQLHATVSQVQENGSQIITQMQVETQAQLQALAQLADQKQQIIAQFETAISAAGQRAQDSRAQDLADIHKLIESQMQQFEGWFQNNLLELKGAVKPFEAQYGVLVGEIQRAVQYSEQKAAGANVAAYKMNQQLSKQIRDLERVQGVVQKQLGVIEQQAEATSLQIHQLSSKQTQPSSIAQTSNTAMRQDDWETAECIKQLQEQINALRNDFDAFRIQNLQDLRALLQTSDNAQLTMVKEQRFKGQPQFMFLSDYDPVDLQIQRQTAQLFKELLNRDVQNLQKVVIRKIGPARYAVNDLQVTIVQKERQLIVKHGASCLLWAEWIYDILTAAK